mgnify:CR=1 FL=1
MKSYQYYIFLSSIIIILVSFGFRLLYIVDNNLKNIKNNTIENFKSKNEDHDKEDFINLYSLNDLWSFGLTVGL